MKFVLLISTAMYAATVLAAPGAISLDRSFKTIDAREDGKGATRVACVQCPCDGFTGACKCVAFGCCCGD